MDPRFPFLELPPSLMLEVFRHLDARELSLVACACRLFRALASDNHGWKHFYCERWGLPSSPAAKAADKSSWRELYVAREARCKALLGKFSVDRLVGHTDTVRALRMLPVAGLAASAGHDSCVRLWNLEEGMAVACSPPLGDTILRGIALDTELLAVGGSRGVVRLWKAAAACRSQLFDISCAARHSLRGHTGPISCLGLDAANVFSGSWDMSVKLWSRARLGDGDACVGSLQHWDWVWALAARGRRLLSTAGSDAYTWDIETGKLLSLRTGVHQGKALAVEGNRSGHHIVTAGEDGAVRLFDNRVPGKAAGDEKGAAHEAVAAWIPHGSAVNSLAFDDPWLVSGSADGTLGLMDLRYLMRRGSSSSNNNNNNNGASSSRKKASFVVQGHTVQRMLGGGGPVYAVDIGGDRIASAGKETAIRVWDFSQALEDQRRAQEQRMLRRKHKKQQQLSHA